MKKGEALPCKECKSLTPQVFNTCTRPCSWLTSWLCHEATADVIKNVTRIKKWGDSGGEEG